MHAQFKKGVLEILVLSILNRRDCYGYELVAAIAEHMDISEGTIYPLLRRFKKDEWVTTYLVESPSGPSRKYYTITDTGAAVYKELYQEWKKFEEAVAAILDEKGESSHE